MNTDAFLTCLGNLGVATGLSAALEGVYSPTSGTTGYFYNQLYTTGAHLQNGVLYGPVIPLVNVYNTWVTGSGVFSGVNGYRAGYQHSGNFAVLMDITYSGCNRGATQKDYVLLSTVDKPSQLSSGFTVGINDANRLEFKTLNKCYTLSTELSSRDFVYIALTENQFVSMGIYKLRENALYVKNITLDGPTLNTNNIYFGNFLTNDDTNDYDGFYGRINQILLFNDDLADTDIASCAVCSIVTGYQAVTGSYPSSGVVITGYQFSGFTYLQTTGTTYVTGKITKNDNSQVSIIYPSGMTGVITSGELTVPLTQQVLVTTSGVTYTYLFDSGALNQLTTRNYEFDLPLTSGDIVEVYTYTLPNANIGNVINGVEWPSGTGIVQLIANGLNETSGVDYWIVHNAISGYFDTDVLTYDYIVANSIVTAYSGYWQTSRVPSGAGYFPPAPQYLESTGLFSGVVKITGLSGVCTGNPFYPRFGYDLHMNGQKLVSGLQYDVVPSGNGYVVDLSGVNLPPLEFTLLYSGTTPTGVLSVDDNELVFIPHFSGATRTRINVTGYSKVLGPFTGCSEQVWVNGIRQRLNGDYIRHDSCDFQTGIFYPTDAPFVIYDSTVYSGLWNTPPIDLQYGGSFDSLNTLDFTSNLTIFGPPNVVLTVNVHQFIDATECAMDTYNLSAGTYVISYNCGTPSIGASMYATIQWVSGNIYGHVVQTNTITN